ncbi:Met-10+ like-protein-domain-containing protein [Macrophomina phaseolina]|uniref:tRNA (guanine(37)-N1)-methyltransferase n=1 Tax=Macrophomina phaseolina TaxID=35725 RepID=A0ABQ8GLD3_9PEZI|nr:Met-10+ like-protein-domain-containing protein [Macrophomina phaseolina]
MSDDAMFRPPVARAMRVLDRSFFQKTFPISAARIANNKDISLVRKTLEKSKDVLSAPRLQSVQPDPLPELAAKGRKCVLLRPDIKHDDPSTWSPTLAEFQGKEIATVVPYNLHLNYDYWTYDDILSAVVPEDNQEDAYPKRFSQVGHILHLNLRDSHQPYKQIIAQVLKDKSHNVETVISKTDNVGDESEFRTFSYEVLIGSPDLNVELHEEGCTFRFDYSKVYWNSRLQAEHRRMVQAFNEGEAVCDVMAGVGPFAVPAGKKRIFTWANDLNPESYACMADAVKRNKVGQFVRAFNTDGHEFIRNATADLYRSSHSVTVKAAAGGLRCKAAGEKAPAAVDPKSLERVLTQPRIFSHYVMNLPANAIDFLPSFIGLFARSPVEEALGTTEPSTLFAPHTDTQLPMVHVYCFGTKSDDNVEQEIDICKRISQKLEFEITRETLDGKIYDVRDVAPNKRMFCASFRLPAEVAFRKA